MYYNVFGEKVSRRKYKEMLEAAKNRRELIAAGLTPDEDGAAHRWGHAGC